MSELIDREATVKQICKIGEMVGGHARDVIISIALFVQDDKSAFPTVEKPHGEWVMKMNGNVLRRECNVCGYSFNADGITHLFCSNCGADMRKER